MIILTASITAAEGKDKELEEVLRGLVKGTATEEGALEYRLHRVKGNPVKFRFIEKFKDQAAFDFHLSTDHFKALGEKSVGLTQGEAEMEMLELIDSIPEK
ncbi:putative quinol monooxygenase [Maridesulfovibrio sp. FT414]|uniref:putative quinol monooxygenase n=1 Tax=Maridesulfovibrio sp. FT414 TaxID=2979469 RepID=UPI003D808B4F